MNWETDQVSFQLAFTYTTWPKHTHTLKPLPLELLTFHITVNNSRRCGYWGILTRLQCHVTPHSFRSPSSASRQWPSQEVLMPLSRSDSIAARLLAEKAVLHTPLSDHFTQFNILLRMFHAVVPPQSERVDWTLNQISIYPSCYDLEIV